MNNKTYYKRVTLVVADIEKSLTIYRDILGFTVDLIKDSDDDSYSYPVFNIPEQAKIRFATLDGPEQKRTLGLTEVKGIKLPAQTGIKMSASVINITDLDDKMAKIIALGLEHTEPKIDGDPARQFKEQSFIDFDGHLIVIYELI